MTFIQTFERQTVNLDTSLCILATKSLFSHFRFRQARHSAYEAPTTRPWHRMKLHKSNCRLLMLITPSFDICDALHELFWFTKTISVMFHPHKMHCKVVVYYLTSLSFEAISIDTFIQTKMYYEWLKGA